MRKIDEDMYEYKGQLINVAKRYIDCKYSCLTDKGMVKADTLQGIKKLIDDVK